MSKPHIIVEYGMLNIILISTVASDLWDFCPQGASSYSMLSILMAGNGFLPFYPRRTPDLM
jgi:hypothetical protein